MSATSDMGDLPVMTRVRHRATDSQRRYVMVLATLGALLLVLLALSCAHGTIPVSLTDLWSKRIDDDSARTRLIVLEMRLPAAIVAMLAGAALGISGLQLQTYFRNPLAGPFVLGVDSGASLGVALMLLGLPLLAGVLPGAESLRDIGITFAAIAGACAVLVLIAVYARYALGESTLIVAGLMLSLLVGSVVTILLYLSDPLRLQSFVLWTFGSFSGVSWSRLPTFALLTVIGAAIATWDARALNALQLGTLQAASLGIDGHRTRQRILLSAAMLAGATTAYCGPLGVLGTVAPQIARRLLSTADHLRLIPVCALCGAVLALVADLLSRLLAVHGTLPLNAMLAILGAPIVLSIILALNRRFP